MTQRLALRALDQEDQGSISGGTNLGNKVFRIDSGLGILSSAPGLNNNFIALGFIARNLLFCFVVLLVWAPSTLL